MDGPSGIKRKYSIRTQLYFVDQNSGNLTLVLGQGNEDFQFKVILYYNYTQKFHKSTIMPFHSGVGGAGKDH